MQLHVIAIFCDRHAQSRVVMQMVQVPALHFGGEGAGVLVLEGSFLHSSFRKSSGPWMLKSHFLAPKLSHQRTKAL